MPVVLTSSEDLVEEITDLRSEMFSYFSVVHKPEFTDLSDFQTEVFLKVNL